MVRINLGSGHWKIDGWVNVDLDMESAPEVCADLSGGLPFRSGCAELMHTEDFVDRVTLVQAAAFFRECHRVLKPGGVLRVLVPDLEKLAMLYLEDPQRLVWLWTEFVGIETLTGTAGEVFNLAMNASGHVFMYDGVTLSRLLADCGFDARRVKYNESDIPALRSLDLRSPDEAISMYYDCYREES